MGVSGDHVHARSLSKRLVLVKCFNARLLITNSHKHSIPHRRTKPIFLWHLSFGKACYISVPRIYFLPFLIALLGTLGLRATTPPVDYSYAGLTHEIPDTPGVVIVAPSGATDATAAIQAAIDKVSALPADKTTGMRGAIILGRGTHPVAGQLRIHSPGVVLRGDGAVLVARGRSRRSLILVSKTMINRQTGPARAVITDTPAGAMRLRLASLDGLEPGQRIVITRPSTAEWIAALGMNRFTGSFASTRLDWSPGSRNIEWDRTIVAIEPDAQSILLDAPITAALEGRYGGGSVARLIRPGRLARVGVENLTLVSDYDRETPDDEEHAWIGIQIEDTEDAWVRSVSTRHFVSAGVWLGSGTKNILVEDSSTASPVGADAGWRRYGFYAGGQLILVQRCRTDGARHPFLAGHCSAGPNVFLDCVATAASGESGSLESCAAGLLFENVTIGGGALVLGNLKESWQGAGWNAVSSTVWNCRADAVRVDSPPGAENLLHESADHVSLFRNQRSSRTAPPLHEMAEPDEPTTRTKEATAPVSLEIKNGRFCLNGRVLFGSATSNAWWKGQAFPARAIELGWSATRWVPGKTGPGLTEDLAELASRLASRGDCLVQVWPGLWYDRRRDDHTTLCRENSDVWAPFFEMPWARSGRGQAADGLSKYDLNRFNPWYWERLRLFASECARRDMILYHHFYNHHNLVEAAAHWTDSPWRPANCLQETGFTEPPPYTNQGTRIGVVAEFYDITHPVRRDLHRKYIWHGLDALADQPNVIHTLAFQFAGPLSFQQFFLDTVAEWRAARGRQVRIALNTSKAVTDAILADPRHAGLVEVIDQRYWQYLADGSLFAPHSGGDRAFREERVAAFGKDAVPAGSAVQAYRQVREYHDLHPGKAVIAPHAGQGPVPVLMAGGALPLLADYSAAQPLNTGRDDRALFAFLRDHLGDCLGNMKPVDTGNACWLLADEEGSARLYYFPEGVACPGMAPDTRPLRTALWFDISGNATTRAMRPDGVFDPASAPRGPALLLLRR